MPVVLEPSWVGRRVSVRRVVDRSPDGRLLLGDVVGDLAGLDAQTAVIQARAGLIEVPVALVTAARLVPPSTADELALEAVLARALVPEHTEQLSGWVLRADDGGTRRANAVLPLRQLKLPLDEALQRASSWYRSHGLPLLIRVPVAARRLLDAELAVRGWPAEGTAHVLTVPLVQLAAGRDDIAVRLDAAADAGWLERYRAGIGRTASKQALLRRDTDAVFASVRAADGRAVAVARGVLDDDWLGIVAVDVAPEQRRRGLATALVGALAGWGAEHGARRAYLQVEVDNEAALALYARLGFTEHHTYHYVREP
jgi:GNAT superfamily N-acetyltransferase